MNPHPQDVQDSISGETKAWDYPAINTGLWFRFGPLFLFLILGRRWFTLGASRISISRCEPRRLHISPFEVFPQVDNSTGSYPASYLPASWEQIQPTRRSKPTGRVIPVLGSEEGNRPSPKERASSGGSIQDTMADEQVRHSVEIMDSIPESRAASPTLPEPIHSPQRREGAGLGLPAALRMGPMPTIMDDAEQSPSRRRGHSISNSLHPVDTNRSTARARAGSTTSSKRRSGNFQRTPTGMAGVRKRTTTWNLSGPSPLERQGTFRRRGTYNLGGLSSGVEVQGDSQSAAGFTLAGPGNALEAIMANQSYVDPGYVDLNPAYEVATNNRPVWGLAKPLPHVVRPGMIPTKNEIVRQTPEQLRHEKQAQEDFDLEAGRVESTMNPSKISSALLAAQQDREFRLMRTYTGSKAFGGANNRRKSSVSSAHARLPTTVEWIGKPEPQDHGRRSSTVTETIAKLASVTEQNTPDESAHPNERGWLADDARAITPINQHMDEEDWVEDPDDLKPYDPELDEIHNLHTHWSVIRLKFREPLAELLAVRRLVSPKTRGAAHTDMEISPDYLPTHHWLLLRPRGDLLRNLCNHQYQLGMGSRCHDWNLHSRWYFWRSSQSSHVNYALDFPRIPAAQNSQLRHSPDPRCFPGRTHQLWPLSHHYHRVCADD